MPIFWETSETPGGGRSATSWPWQSLWIETAASWPCETAFLVGEFLRHQEVEDRDVLVHRVFLLPGRRLHLFEAGADDHLHVVAAEPARGAAAVHGGVAAAEHDHPLADLVDVAERDRR